MESLFLSRLEALQPDPGYMALLRAIVEDVWREDQRETAERGVEIERELASIEQRLDQLENAFIWEKRDRQGDV